MRGSRPQELSGLDTILQRPAEAVSINSWFVHKEARGLGISRFWIDSAGSRHKQRFPREELLQITGGSPVEIENLAIRLNGKDPKEEAALRRYHEEVAWISDDFLEGYYLESE